jgi:putative flippase GtrA
VLSTLSVKSPRQLLTAGFGGVVATLFDISALVLLVESGVSVPVAAFFAAGAGAAMNFVLNKYIAFRDRSPITLQQLCRFGAVAVATALLMAVAMNIVAVQLGVQYMLAKLVCAVIVFVAWTYPAQKTLVFPRRVQGATWPELERISDLELDPEIDAEVEVALDRRAA